LLNDEQRSTFEKGGYFVASDGRGSYRIKNRRSRDADLIDSRWPLADLILTPLSSPDMDNPLEQVYLSSDFMVKWLSGGLDCPKDQALIGQLTQPSLPLRQSGYRTEYIVEVSHSPRPEIYGHCDAYCKKFNCSYKELSGAARIDYADFKRCRNGHPKMHSSKGARRLWAVVRSNQSPYWWRGHRDRLPS
jgi:hypothetical protein